MQERRKRNPRMKLHLFFNMDRENWTLRSTQRNKQDFHLCSLNTNYPGSGRTEIDLMADCLSPTPSFPGNSTLPASDEQKGRPSIAGSLGSTQAIITNSSTTSTIELPKAFCLASLPMSLTLLYLIPTGLPTHLAW